MPAAIASTASTVFTVAETLTLSSGKSPVRINQIASRIIPRFLPARVLVIATVFSPVVFTDLTFVASTHFGSMSGKNLAGECEHPLRIWWTTFGIRRIASRIR